MGKHQQKRGKNLNDQLDFFEDNINSENKRLRAEAIKDKKTIADMQSVIDQQNLDKEKLQIDLNFEKCKTKRQQREIEYMTAQVVNLNKQLSYFGEDGEVVRFSLKEILKYCLKHMNKEEYKPVKIMLGVFLRHIATEAEFNMLDDMDEEMEKKEKRNTTIHANHLTMNNAQIHGPLYDVNNNENVNVGEE